MSSAVVSSAALVRADGASARGAASGTSKAAPPPNAFASRVLRRRRGGGADLATPPSRGRCASIRTQVAERNPNVVDVDEDELRYREMMRITKEWMAYDPDDVPESTPAPWETHIRELMQNGPWPCWNADLPESHFEPEPEFVPFETAPEAYSAFDDKAKLWREKVFVERARVTAKRQAEIRSRNWMQMDRDIRLADIPSCVEAGWSHDKILDLIAYPEHVQQAMESYSVHIYDPRFPIDNTWIEPPAPDTWEFIRKIGHAAGPDDEDEERVSDRIAAQGGIIQRYDDESEVMEFLSQTSETKLARAIDIGEDDDEDETLADDGDDDFKRKKQKDKDDE